MMSRYRIHPACTFLIKAFSPGCPTMLRCWSAKLEPRGERVHLLYDLPTDEAVKRAEQLAANASALRLVAIGGKAIRELTADIHEDFRTLTVSALVVRD